MPVIFSEHTIASSVNPLDGEKGTLTPAMGPSHTASPEGSFRAGLGLARPWLLALLVPGASLPFDPAHTSAQSSLLNSLRVPSGRLTDRADWNPSSWLGTGQAWQPLWAPTWLYVDAAHLKYISGTERALQSGGVIHLPANSPCEKCNVRKGPRVRPAR